MNAYSMTKQCLKDMKRSLRLEWLSTAKERRNKCGSSIYFYFPLCVYRKKAMNLFNG